MTTFNLDNDNSNHSQETHAGHGTPSQSSPKIRGNGHFDNHLSDPLSTPMLGPGIEPSPNSTVYEGYKFFKADPIPGQEATWTRVERTQMHISQSELYKMVQERANKMSAAQQYHNLSDTRRAHVNQLIHEQRRGDPQVEWSCVYAKERDRPSKARNAHRDDYETVSMEIILMKRPIKTKSYPRTPMGDLVDLGVPFRLDGDDAQSLANRRSDLIAQGKAQERLPELAAPRFHPRRSQSWSQKDQPFIPGHVVQGPLPRPVSVTSPFTRLDLGKGTLPVSFDGNAERFLEK